MEAFLTGALASMIISLGYYGFKKLTDPKDIKLRLIIFAAVFGVLVIVDIIITCIDDFFATSLLFLVIFGWRICIDAYRLSQNKSKQNSATPQQSSNFTDDENKSNVEDK